MDATANVDGAALIPEIEEQMARDEAEWAKAEGRPASDAADAAASAQSRDGQGRFTGAKDGQRAGQAEAEPELPEEGDSATANQSEQAATQAAGPEAQQNPPEAGATKPKTGENQPETQNAKPETGKTAWAKENERKARTWEGINETKKQLEADREQLRLEREAHHAQLAAANAQVKDSHGYTAEQYDRSAKVMESKAQRLTQEAMVAEQAGDFAKADELHTKAGEAQTAGKAMLERAAGLKGGNVWDRLKQDLPEALQFNGPLNVELRKMLRGNPQLLGDPMGPYRAAVQVGRNVLQATEQKLAAANTEAAKVPALLKQVEELSARVKELQAATSLPGGGAAMSRGGSGGRKFEDLSVEEMERELAAEAV